MQLLNRKYIILPFILIYFSIFAKDINQKQIGLTLSGGGARGLSHIGVIRKLEEVGIRPDFISGASMGAVIASWYALGYNSYQIENFIKKVDLGQILSDSPFRKNLTNYNKNSFDKKMFELYITKAGIRLPNSISHGQRILQFLSQSIYLAPLYNMNFDKLPIKLRIVCTDLQDGKKVVFKKGDLPRILRGTISFPGILTPIDYDNMRLADGGLIDNIPTDIIKDSCDILLLSNSSHYVSSVDREYNFVELLDRISVAISEKTINKNISFADYHITPKIKDVSLTDFRVVDSIINLGYQTASPIIEKMLKEHPNLINNKKTNHNVNIMIAKDSINLQSQLPENIKQIVFQELPTYVNIDSIVIKVKHILISNGYPFIDVSYSNTNGSKQLKINLQTIKNISIRGNKNSSSDLIKHNLYLEEGDILTINDINNSINNLYGLNIFHNISYLINKKQRHIYFQVKEKPPHAFSLGMNYTTGKGFYGLIEFSSRNPINWRNIGKLSILSGKRRTKIDYSYYSSFFKKSALFFEMNPFYHKYEFNYYDQDYNSIGEYNKHLSGINIQTGFQLYNNYMLKFMGSYQYLYYDIPKKIDYTIKNKHVDILASQTQIIVDTRDKKVFPEYGGYLNIALNNYFPISVSKHYLKFTLDFQYFYQILDYLNLNYSISVGGSDRNLPNMGKYRNNGRNFIPGIIMDKYTFSQYTSQNIGIRTLLYNTEFINLYCDLKAYNQITWNSPSTKINTGKISQSYLISFAINTPLGPLSLGGGIKNEESTNSNSAFIYLSAGYSLY